MLVENKSILLEKRKILHEQSLSLNETKREIDELRDKLDDNTVRDREEKDRVLEEEEYENICKLTELKGRYKELLSEIKGLRNQIEHCQVLVDQTRQKMLTDFDNWYQLTFSPSTNTLG